MNSSDAADATSEAKKGILVRDVIAAFDATPIRSIYPAADQDGFDGGTCSATGPDPESVEWSEADPRDVYS